MILVCIRPITDESVFGPKTIHDLGYMLWLQDRTKQNIGFNKDCWRLATDIETQIYHTGVRDLTIAIKKTKL